MTGPAVDEHLTRHLGAGAADTRLPDLEIWRHERLLRLSDDA